MSKTWDKVKDALGGAAPLIGTLLGGAPGGMVGSLISSALGVENTPDAIEKELRTNPEAVLKLKELELTHKTKFEELALEDTKVRLVDTQDARRSEIERVKAGGSNKFMYTLAGLVVFGFFGVVGMLFFLEIPEASENVTYMLLGTLAAEFGSIMRYFFGSSKGSSDKTAMLMKGK